MTEDDTGLFCYSSGSQKSEMGAIDYSPGVGRAAFLLTALGENPLPAFPGFWEPPASLGL